MKIYLLDINKNIIDAWNRYFYQIENVDVVYADFDTFMQNYDVECVVSPGNSRGVMAGGYDRAISEYFGWDLTKQAQEYIKKNFAGQQPVGTSFIIETGMENIKLIHTPSMIVPSRIKDANVVYNCTKSTLELAKANSIKSIVIPAFGGACGGLEPQVIANKMFCAYQDFRKEIAHE